MAGPAWLIKPFTGPMSDTFAEHAARAPGYAFKGQDGAWSTPDDWNIVASHDGVVDLRFDRDYGNHIYIDGGGKDDDWGTLYGHLAKFYVEDGERVSAGQSIGLMGATGNAKGIHLHHELRINGRQVDPAPYYVSEPPRARRKKKMTVLYRNNGDRKPPVPTYAIAGGSPGTPANWVEIPIAGVDPDIERQLGPSIPTSLEFFAAVRKQYLSPVSTTGGASVAAAAVAAELKPLIPTAEQNGAAARAAIVK